MAARLDLLRNMIGLSVSDFLKQVYFNIVVVSAVAAIFPVFLYVIMPNGWLRFVVVITASLISSSFSILFVGCSKKERVFVKNKLIYFTNKVLVKNDTNK